MIIKISDEELKNSRPSLEALEKTTRNPVVVLLENIRSLYNVGSIFRSSDGALIEKLFLTGYTGYPPRKEIDKTSLGSVESVPWEYQANSLEAVKKLKSNNYQIVSLEQTSKSIPYNKASYQFPLCLILGNEVKGISPEILQESDLAIDIPMLGRKQSLNVTVAYGIVLYHLITKYKFANPIYGLEKP